MQTYSSSYLVHQRFVLDSLKPLHEAEQLLWIRDHIIPFVVPRPYCQDSIDSHAAMVKQMEIQLQGNNTHHLAEDVTPHSIIEGVTTGSAQSVLAEIRRLTLGSTRDLNTWIEARFAPLEVIRGPWMLVARRFGVPKEFYPTLRDRCKSRLQNSGRLKSDLPWDYGHLAIRNKISSKKRSGDRFHRDWTRKHVDYLRDWMAKYPAVCQVSQCAMFALRDLSSLRSAGFDVQGVKKKMDAISRKNDRLRRMQPDSSAHLVLLSAFH